MDNVWIAGVFGIFGSIVGGISTYFASLHLESKRLQCEGLILGQSLSAEISSIVSLLHGHNYQCALEIAIQKTSRGEPFAIVWPVKRDYCRVFNGNVSKIGLLKSGATEVVKFYNLVQSLTEDLVVFGTDIEDIFRNQRQEAVDWRVFSSRYTNISSKLKVLIASGEAALTKIPQQQKV